MKIVSSAVLVFVALLAGCSGAGDRPRPLAGQWGGESAVLVLVGEGGWIDIGCAWGTFDVPLVLDRTGRFDVQGRYVAEQGPPDFTVAQLPPDQPARYEGWLDNETLTVRVTPAGQPTVGPFFLRRREESAFARYCY